MAYIRDGSRQPELHAHRKPLKQPLIYHPGGISWASGLEPHFRHSDGIYLRQLPKTYPPLARLHKLH